MDGFIRQMEAQQRRGRVLPFVRGLRLSALLIYEIRRMLQGTHLSANWGHLVDEDGRLCSCECDVIIHGNDGCIEQWDGTSSPIMDFCFVAQQSAVLVISCKSYVRPAKIDREYCQLMRPFVDRVWLFAECCGPLSAQSVRDRAVALGYEEFWFLYKWSKQSDPDPNIEGWSDFVSSVHELAVQTV